MQSPDHTKTKSLDLKNLIFFFLIAFGWTWTWWYVLFLSGWVTVPEGVGTREIGVSGFQNVLILILVALSPFGPTIAGFIMTAINEGKAGVRALWKRFWNLKINWKWLLVIFLWWPGLRLITNLVGQLITGVPTPLLVYPDQFWIFIPSLIVSTFINGGMSEEFGWRGYALPRLQSKFSAVTAAIILGLIEGAWHFPLKYMGQWWQESYLMMLFWFILTVILRTWIFNNTNGNLLAMMLFHGMGNAQSDIIWCCSGRNHVYWVYGIATLLVVLIFGYKTLTRKPKPVEDTA